MEHSPSSLFNHLVQTHCTKKGVSSGKMMTAPALKYNNKVYAFFWEEEMTFKLGKDYDILKEGVKEIRYLSPFKNKAPMKAWYIIPNEEMELWEALALKSLKYIQSE